MISSFARGQEIKTALIDRNLGQYYLTRLIRNACQKPSLAGKEEDIYDTRGVPRIRATHL